MRQKQNSNGYPPFSRSNFSMELFSSLWYEIGSQKSNMAAVKRKYLYLSSYVRQKRISECYTHTIGVHLLNSILWNRTGTLVKDTPLWSILESSTRIVEYWICVADLPTNKKRFAVSIGDIISDVRRLITDYMEKLLRSCWLIKSLRHVSLSNYRNIVFWCPSYQKNRKYLCRKFSFHTMRCRRRVYQVKSSISNTNGKQLLSSKPPVRTRRYYKRVRFKKQQKSFQGFAPVMKC